MAKKPITNNISLDTSFFEGQNFLAGSKIKELADLCQKGIINIFLTDITYRELLARFRKNMEVTSEKIIKPKDLLVNHAKLLRNFSEFKVYFELPTIDIEALCLRYHQDFDEWLIKNNVVIIPTGHLEISNIFEDYFANNSPFKEGEKKNEFPDAFTLKAIVEYFSILNSKTYLLSSDNDLLTFKSKSIIPVGDASDLLDTFIRTSPEKLAERAIKLIEKEFKVVKAFLEKDTKDMIIRAIDDEMGSTFQIVDLEITSINKIEVCDIEIEEFSIVSLDTTYNTAKLESETNFSFEVLFSADDYSEAYHDNEDGTWHFIESKKYSIEDAFNIQVTISAYFNLENDSVSLEVEDINNGNKLDIIDSFKPWRH